MQLFAYLHFCLHHLIFFTVQLIEKLNNPTQTSSWPDFMPSTLVKLGLDLRGGVYMLLEVKTDDVIREKFDFLWTDIRSSLVEKKERVGINTKR